MKRKFTQICFVVMCMVFAGKSYAATITATLSGSWSNAATWSGGTAGATVGGLDNIVIPAGITVTLDMDVQVTSILSSISVSGNLTSSSTHSLMINQGSLSGNGNMTLHYLELGTTGGMTFTGNLTVNRFVTSNANLSLASHVVLMDTMELRAGSLSLGSGSMLSMNTNSNIKISDGSLAINGGVFAGTNTYNIMYVGSSKSTGLEWNGTGATDAYVQLSSSSQSLTLASDMTVNGTLHHNMGTLKLNGNNLILKGDYMAMNNSMIAGSATSDLTIQTPTNLSSDLTFTSGGQLNNFVINMGLNGNVIVTNDLAITTLLNLQNGKISMTNNGTLKMNSGSTIRINNSTILLTTGGTFDGLSSYNVVYDGISKQGMLELTGAGLNNVMIDLNNTADSIKMSSNVMINGTLTLNKGALNLQGHNLDLKGDLSSTSHGYIQSYSSSNITINTTTGLTDTLNFHSTMNKMNNLSINTGSGGSNVMLGTDVWVENLTFVNGGISIYNNNLNINSTGTITGYGMNKYVSVNGTGSLMMNVNTSSPYVTFPVGTTTSYAPASLQLMSGTSGMMGVGTRNGVWSMGTSGTDLAGSLSVVNRSWNISSAAGGSMNYNLKLEWASAMEVNSFNRNSSYISQYTSNWDAMTASTSTVTSNGYMMQRSGLTSTGPVAVVDNLSSVGVAELEAVNVSFYPNPATEAVTMTVKNTGAYSIEVFDAVGNKVISKIVTTEPSTKVDLSSLNTGVYFVKISDDKSQSIKKVIKQ